MRPLLLALLVSLTATRATAQPPASPPSPCAADSNSHRFDFWIGEWDVKTPNGGAAGQSSVQSVSGGCGLLENWAAANGSTGKSLNGYNRALGRWQQFWIGQGGMVTEYRESSWDGPTLRLVARQRSASGDETLMRMSFTPMADGVVRQVGEQSTDGGATWALSYDLRYHRRR